MRLFPTRLRTRLVLVALVAVLPTIAVMAFDQAVDRRRARERALAESLRLTELAAGQQASVFAGAQRFLQTLAQFPGLRVPKDCNKVLPAVLREHPGYLTLAVLDADGTVGCASSPKAVSLRLADRPWFQRAIRARTSVLGEYQIGRGTTTPDIVLAHPLIGETGAVEQVLAVALELGQLDRWMSAVRLPEGSTLTLFDRTRSILARYPDPERWVGKQVPETPVIQRLRAGAHEDITETVGVDNVRRLYVTVPVEAGFDTGLYVGVGIDHDAAFAEADRLLRQQIRLFGLLSIAVMGAALTAAQTLVIRPLNALKAVTSRLAAGDLTARVQLTSGVRELNDLGDEVDSMATALEWRQQQLQISEERYRLLFHQNPQPMWVYDLETLQFLEVNGAAVRQYGYSRDEFLAMRLMDIRPPEDVPRLLADGGGSQPTPSHSDTWRHRVKSGRIIDVEITSHSFVLNGRSARLVLAQDVTERKRAETALAERSAIVESSEDAIVGKTLDGTIGSWNAGAEKLYGYRADEIIGKSVSLLIPEDRSQELADLLNRLRTGQHLTQYETVRRRKDGSPVSVSLTLSPIRNAAGNVVGAASIARDISERQRAEQALRESERRFWRIAETVSEVFWMADVDRQTMLYVSPAYERIWGRSCDSLYRNPSSFIEAIHPEDRARVLEDLQVQQAGLPFDHEYRIVRPDGTIRSIWDRGFPVPNDGDPIVQYVGASQDITQRVKAERARHEAEERMRFALAASHVGVWESDLKTGVAFWSETCEVMHGLTPGMFGNTFDAFIDRIHPDDRQEMLRRLDQATREHRNVDLEYRTTWPDGSQHRICATGHFFYDENGVAVRGAGVATDVTERRSLEDQLRQSQKMEAVGQLAGGIAHDFNNVLTAMLGNAELVRNELAADDPRRAHVEEITKAGHRASRLTHQLLAFSRKQILAPRVLHLGDVVSEVIPMLRRLLGEPIDLRTTLGEHGRVKADAGQMEQVLVNLAVNARDAMPDGGRLTIETADVLLDDAYVRQHPTVHPGPHVMIAVSDTGQGMDAAMQRRIFEPFFTTKPIGQGTGLGLATVYGIVKQSGGHIWVYSEMGRGTTFKIYVPRTQEVEKVPLRPANVRRSLRGVETILLVEDEEIVREFGFKVLSRHGYTVYPMAEPKRAIEFAEAHHGVIHLILTDVVLPEMSGRTMTTALQKCHPESKVLYTSGYTDSAIVHHGVLDAGMSFLQKPFAADALVRRVRDVLDAVPA